MAQAGGIMWLLLARGDEGGESCSRLRRLPGAGTVLGVQQEDESLKRGTGREESGRAGVAYAGTSRLCRCARGNTMAIVHENTFVWNTGGLR